MVKLSREIAKVGCQICENMISKWKIEDSHLKDHNKTGLTVYTACLYVKRVILYDF